MGSEILSPAASDISQPYRQHFPVTEKLLYLNHAAVAPLCRRSAEAMKQFADENLFYGSFHYEQWIDAHEGLRVATAKLINASKTEIAIVKNTSEGISTIALGIDWKPGDRVVAFQEEFPANVYPWQLLEKRGVQVQWLSITDPLEKIDQAARGARLLTISFVQYLSGYRADLAAIGEICHRHGCFFFVDAIQGLGAFPLDVRKCRIHALASDGHKWLLGPEGCGILYVQRELQDSVFPAEFGYTNIANFTDYGTRSTMLRADAARYEPGTLNTIGCFGLRASINFLLEVGINRIAAQVQALGDRIAEGVKAKGYEVLGERTPENSSGIVSFRNDTDPRVLWNRLKAENILTAPRQGWLRTSPHFYISFDDVDRLLHSLP